jgi:hypothetical protein
MRSPPLLIGLAAAFGLSCVSVSSAAGPRGGCTLSPETPALTSDAQVRFKAAMRCERKVRRTIAIDRMAVLASGKVVVINGTTDQATFRAGFRGSWTGSAPCRQLVERVTRRHSDDAPEHLFVRMTLSSHDERKRYQRKDSPHVAIDDLCPER